MIAAALLTLVQKDLRGFYRGTTSMHGGMLVAALGTASLGNFGAALAIRVGMHATDRTRRENSRCVQETRAARFGNSGVGGRQSAASGFAPTKEQLHERRELAEGRR